MSWPEKLPSLQYREENSRFFSMRFCYFLLFLFLTAPIAVRSQVRLLLHAGAGTSNNTYKGNSSEGYYDYYTYEGSDGLYVFPQAGAALMVPIGKKLIFETGVNFTQKQFRAEEGKITDINTAKQYNVLNEYKTRLGYLNFPFTLSYVLPVSAKSDLHFGAGMNYGFLLKAKEMVTTRQMSVGNPLDEYQYERKVPVGLIQTSNTVDGTLNIFDAAVKLQLSYVWKKQLMVRLFHEYSLYSVYLRQDRNKPDINLRFTGICIGYIF